MAIKRKLTFVVGAGASCELGLPTGRQLLDAISNLASERDGNYDAMRGTHVKRVEIKDEELINFLQRVDYRHQIDDRKNLACWIAQNCSLAPSIDNLLHSHKDNAALVEIGKAMICSALIKAEQSSCLMPETKDGSRKFLSQVKQKNSAPLSWLGQLFWLLAEGSSFKDFILDLKKISFISFNYDRTIQHFLVNAAASYFRLNEESKISDVYKSINVVFPYGNLGELQISEDGAKGFGLSDLRKSIDGIKTFTEGLDEKVDRNRLFRMVSDCDELIFLGFGFHDINLRLLFDGDFSTKLSRVSGTAKGLSDRNKEAVATKIADQLAPHHTKLHLWGSDRVRLEDLSCYEYFSANSIGLRS